MNVLFVVRYVDNVKAGVLVLSEVTMSPGGGKSKKLPQNNINVVNINSLLSE